MPVRIIGDQTKNEVRINQTFMQRSNGTVILRGTGNVLIIDTPRQCSNLMMNLSGGSRFEMRANTQVLHFHLFLRDGAEAVIGQNTTVNGKLNLQSHERALISIGSNCIIAGGLQCMASDMHSIIDIESNERINAPANVIIEDRVWVGFDVTMFKSTHIGSGSVVGARSTVSGAFRENSLILGFPARVARRGVTWKSALVPMPEQFDQAVLVAAAPGT